MVFQVLQAKEQKSYDEKGELRTYDDSSGGGGKTKILDEGHEGWTLRQFVEYVNGLLKKHNSHLKVTDDEILTIRMYTGSTFTRFNRALRRRGTAVYAKDGDSDDVAPLAFSYCIQAARNGLMNMQ